MSKRVSKARDAYIKRDIKETKQAHSKKSIHAPEEHGNAGNFVGDFVYGAIDGSVTTFAVVSGVAGAALGANIVIILGLANLLADGFSMAVGNYLSSRSDKEFMDRERKREEWEIENYPKGEIEEIRQIYKKKGFKGKDLEKAVKIITSDKKVWVDTMMTDELHLIADKVSPVSKGAVTFASFVIVGSIPLIPYFLSIISETIKDNVYMLSVIMTMIAFFFIGTAKVYITEKNWLKSGMETFLIGGIAAIISYGIGFMLRGLA
ncbi:VIT1/CCC1 transporter family protein [Candidatus Woesearchaeota archaeon]|nr:VIT1/CCC1 transporter family protein [Candidatus Woesearchaeota archaeon]